MFKKVLLTLAALVVAFYGFGYFYGDPNRTRASAAIDECRRTAGDDLIDRSGRQLARGACEKMESQFVEKYNSRP